MLGARPVCTSLFLATDESPNTRPNRSCMATRITPFPTAAQTIKVVLHWQAHQDDAAAFAELLEHAGHVVKATAGRAARNYKMAYEDVEQVALAGLVIAARNYARSLGKFLSYAKKVISFGVIEYVSRQVRSGVHVGNDRYRRLAVLGLNAARKQLTEAGIEITPESLAAKLGIPPEIAAAIAHTR